MTAKKQSKGKSAEDLPGRFTYLHELWLSLDHLSCIISQNWDSDWESSEEAETEVQEYGEDIREASALIDKGIADYACPLAAEARIYVNSIHTSYLGAQQQAELCVAEGQADFCGAFYAAFLNRAKPLTAGLTLLVAKIEQERGPALKAIDVDFERLRMREGEDRKLLDELCDAWPDGVQMPDAETAKRRASRLRETLRQKKRPFADEIAAVVMQRGKHVKTRMPLRRIERPA